ncbi:MAG TPA: class I SAM-dependent methyltransferase [Kofleriaceae bacterium]|nr:class I SAM-dependent methyltransferase [Kofleriaceae bacterium]
MTTLTQPDVSALLDELFHDAARADAPITAQFRALDPAARNAMLADYKQTYGAARDAYLAVSREAGTLLYSLARARGARTIVEFGTSFGISTIYLAAALRDGGGGRLITSELEPSKAARARANLERAGLADLVDVRTGDALDTLADVPAGVDFLYLDGAKTLYRPVLDLVAPRLAERAVVVADNIDMAELVAPYTAYVRDPANGFVSNRVVVGEGLEISVRVA